MRFVGEFTLCVRGPKDLRGEPGGPSFRAGRPRPREGRRQPRGAWPFARPERGEGGPGQNRTEGDIPAPHPCPPETRGGRRGRFLQPQEKVGVCLSVWWWQAVLSPPARDRQCPFGRSGASSCRGAHVERRRADSSSCCHLRSREQFQELMASHPANPAAAARVRVRAAGTSCRRFTRMLRGTLSPTPLPRLRRGLGYAPSPGREEVSKICELRATRCQ